VVGEKERAEQTVNVRTRDNVVHGEHKLADVLRVLQEEKAARSLEGHFGHSSNGEAPQHNGHGEV
jgi:threonyl-tRNA synthetase